MKKAARPSLALSRDRARQFWKARVQEAGA